MPPLGSSRQRSDVYNVLLIVSAAFLSIAVLLTLAELRSDYAFFGSDAGFVAGGSN